MFGPRLLAWQGARRRRGQVCWSASRNLRASSKTVAAVERGHGGVLVIQCAAGIGKSALLRAVCEQATDQGLRTLTARASELERDFGFRRGSRAAGGTDRPYRRARAR